LAKTEEEHSIYGEIERNAYEFANHLKAEVARMCAERGVPVSAISFGVGTILYRDFCLNSGNYSVAQAANGVPALEEPARVKRKYTRRKMLTCLKCKESGKTYEAPNKAVLFRHYADEHGTKFGGKRKK